MFSNGVPCTGRLLVKAYFEGVTSKSCKGFGAVNFECNGSSCLECGHTAATSDFRMLLPLTVPTIMLELLPAPAVVPDFVFEEPKNQKAA